MYYVYAIIILLIIYYILHDVTRATDITRTIIGGHHIEHVGGQPCACNPKGENIKRCPQVLCKRPGLLLSAYKNIGGNGVQGDKIYPLPSDTPLPSNITLAKGQVLGSVTVYQDYRLTFDIIPKAINNQWSNIIHFSSSQKDCCDTGDRMPGIWFTPGTSALTVVLGDTNPGQGNWDVVTDPLPLSQKSTFNLTCKGKNIIITVAGKTYNFVQPSLRPVGRAVVYAADPWYDTAQADISNLYYESTPDSPVDYSNFNEEIDFDWNGMEILGTGRKDDVYLQFEGYIKSPYTGDLFFRVQSDDGAELKINNKTVVSMWKLQVPTYGASGPIKAERGQYLPIELKYYQHTGGAVLRLYWKYDTYDWQIIQHKYFSRDDQVQKTIQKIAPPVPPVQPIQQVWQQIPGALTHVSAGNEWTWGIGKTKTPGGNDVYKCKTPCKGGWSLVPGGLTQLDVGGADVWGVNQDGAIFKRSVDGTGDWQTIYGVLKHVSVGPTDWVWGVNSNDDIYRCTVQGTCHGQWEQIPGKLKQIDVGSDSVWGVNSNNNIYTRPVDGTGQWVNIPGKLKYVTVGDQYIYGVDPNNAIYRCKKPCTGGNWELMPGSLRQLEANNREIMGTNIYNNIFSMNTL